MWSDNQTQPTPSATFRGAPSKQQPFYPMNRPLGLRFIVRSSFRPSGQLNILSTSQLILGTFCTVTTVALVPDPFPTYSVQANVLSLTRSRYTHSAVVCLLIGPTTNEEPYCVCISQKKEKRPPRKCMLLCFWEWPCAKATLTPNPRHLTISPVKGSIDDKSGGMCRGVVAVWVVFGQGMFLCFL